MARTVNSSVTLLVLTRSPREGKGRGCCARGHVPVEDKARMKAGEGTRDWITLRSAIALDSFFGYNFNATFLVLFLMFFLACG